MGSPMKRGAYGPGSRQGVLGALGRVLVVLVYGPNVAIESSMGNLFAVVPSDGVAFQIDAPTNPPGAGQTQRLTIKIDNVFGVLGALTFQGGAAGFTIGAAWAQPAVNFVRSIDFDWDGAIAGGTGRWVEANRSAVDVNRS